MTAKEPAESGTGKFSIMSVSIPAAMHAGLKSLAAAQGRSLSNFVAYHLAKRFEAQLGAPTIAPRRRKSADTTSA